MSKIKAYRKLVGSSLPGPVMRYFYIRDYYGLLWAADIEEEVAECGGDGFIWDDDPCGRSLRLEEIDDYLSDADEIGYIEDKKLFITKRWSVPTGYGYKHDLTPVVTSWEVVGKL